jgi:hypothetical protein
MTSKYLFSKYINTNTGAEVEAIQLTTTNYMNVANWCKDACISSSWQDGLMLKWPRNAAPPKKNHPVHVPIGYYVRKDQWGCFHPSSTKYFRANYRVKARS